MTSVDPAATPVDETFTGPTAAENQHILEQFGSVEGKRVLDYGCGAAEGGIYLAKLGANPQEKKHESKAYHVGTVEGKPLALHFASDKVLVVGSEPGVTTSSVALSFAFSFVRDVSSPMFALTSLRSVRRPGSHE